jgi:hypothetical protein
VAHFFCDNHGDTDLYGVPFFGDTPQGTGISVPDCFSGIRASTIVYVPDFLFGARVRFGEFFPDFFGSIRASTVVCW